jgi:hypothetical protein
MGNKPSTPRAPLDPSRGLLPTGKSCTVPDTTYIDRRIYQVQLIDRACEILSRVLRNGVNTSDFVGAQIDAMYYKDENNIDDPEISVVVNGKPVKYRYHQWSILLDKEDDKDKEDKVLLGKDRKNVFAVFQEPLDGNMPVEVVRPMFKDYLQRFTEAKLRVLKALRKECITK